MLYTVGEEFKTSTSTSTAGQELGPVYKHMIKKTFKNPMDVSSL